MARYELKELLGEGGMGVVYRALDTRTNSYVALKTLRDAADPATLEMFKREWAELARLSHPNIVDIRDVDEIEENGLRKPCFIMPLLPGATLAALIKNSSPRLTTEFVVGMVSQVAKGLEAAHEKDLIHRDLKPSNIFIMNDDTAKIIDFGLVHAAGNKSATGLKGTWQYMSPEQIEGREPHRSFDIFSLGVVAYEALTGHQPFKRAQFEETRDAVRRFIPQAIPERNPKVPELVGKAVHVAMAKQPIHRYASAREFAETLQKAYNNQYVERFDAAKIRPRIERAKRAFAGGDSEFAGEILAELEAEGNLDPDITLLRSQIDEHGKQKRIRQLLEAAQTRLEQEEIPLALEKLEEILKIDAENPDALKLRRRAEQERSDQQAAGWLKLAREHLELHDFGEARRALKEVFNLKYDDPEAAQLKAEVDAREKEAATVRGEKEQLYSSALKAQNNGEISSALSKLEKLLDLSRVVPGAAVPERDKVFQAFYNDVRTERDRIDNAYAEGARHLSEKNFQKALETCDGILGRYPKNPQFQALRLKVEHAQRQELSAYIAEVGRAADGEPNLDRRVGLLEEAAKRYPGEEQFARQLSLARDLRDLVASIVARARAYEEQGQFSEASAQWNTLSNIHPQYPGIAFEISQLERRRERQERDEKKSRLVQRIDRALENAAYPDAERYSRQALLEFPQDQELLALLRLSQQGLGRTAEANRLFEEAKTRQAAEAWDEALGLLRQALELDPRNIVIQNTLVNWLVARAHAVLDANWAEAEPYAAEAGRLDAEHPSVKKIISLISQAKTKDEVERSVLQARGLQSTDRHGAIDVLKLALAAYPGEGRLQQTLTSLQNEEPRALAARAGASAPVENETVVHPLVAAPVPATSPSAPAPRPPAAAALFAFLRENSRNVYGALLGLLAAVLLFLFGHWMLNRPAARAPVAAAPAPQQIGVAIQTTPSDAAITLDGRPLNERTVTLVKGRRFHVAVSRAGYRTVDTTLEASGQPWVISLVPEPLRVSISTPRTKGTVFWDDRKESDLEDGVWSAAYPLKAGEEQHTLSLKSGARELFRLKLKAAAGQPPAVEPFQAKDVMVASTLGDNAPTLTVSVNSDPNLATIAVSAYPPNAKLFIDGAPRRAARAGFWSWSANPGVYQAKLAAEGMADEEFTIKVRKGEAFSRRFELKAKGPVPAGIAISGGTPGAAVTVDDVPVGELDQEGNLSYSGVTAGLHNIQLKKPGYEPRTFRENFSAGKTLNLPGEKALAPLAGNVTFSLTPAAAAVSYRRAGENEWRAADAKGLRLPPGSYEFAAALPNYKKIVIPAVIEAEKTKPLTFVLTEENHAPPPPVLLNMSDAQRDGDWITGKDPKTYLTVRPGASKNTLIFLKRPKPKHLQWTVTLDSANSIAYSLDAQGLSITKHSDGDKSTEPAKIDASNSDGSATYAVVLSLEPHAVRVSKRDGTPINTVSDDKHDWSRARIAVKGDAYFTVWPGQ